MKRSAFQTRVSAFREKLADIPPDAAWIIQPENRRYLSGFKAEDAQLNESSGSLLINHKADFLITKYRSLVVVQAADVFSIQQVGTVFE